MEKKSSPIFVTQLDPSLADKLLQDLKEQNFTLSSPPHTRFSAKKNGVNCTLYESGKLVIQGKDSHHFIEFYIEPELLKTFTSHLPSPPIDFISHIGIDESGKGDFFGPLCIAGVYVSKEQSPILQKIGVKDSKALTDKAIRKIGMEIKKNFTYQVVKINPPKYNLIYTEFKNLNRLLAWGHATAIEQLVIRTGCNTITIDQFADEHVVETALKRKKLDAVHLTQRHRAEEDLVVAAASILARLAFIEGIDELSEKLGIILPKGCSAATTNAGRQILSLFGEHTLREVCKQHFKTLSVILNN